MRRKALLAVLVFGLPVIASGYPNGTPQYVTDTGPFCASCHSAVKAEYMPELPKDLAQRETPEGKHYWLVNLPSQPSPYLELTKEDKERIIKEAKQIDSNTSVKITAPSKVKAGADLEVTVRFKGGNGPSVGIMLVDRALRFQSRPVSSAGWEITGEPSVKGQDGEQSAWLDRRIKGSARNLNYVMIENQRFDLDKNIYPDGEVSYKLKAPEKAGSHTLAAAMLYGTENTGKAGFFQRPSGRILFSDEITIQVE